MHPLEYLMTALTSISESKIRSLLTMLGVIIGVMSVILLVSLGEGAQAYVEKEFAGLGSNILQVTPGKQETFGAMPLVAGSFRKLTYENAKEIERKAAGVKAVSAVVIGAGTVRHSNLKRDTTILAVTPNFESIRNINVQVGRFISESDIERNNKVCVVGTTIMNELFGGRPPLHEWVAINRTKHQIVGILETKGMTLGINMDDIVIIPLPSGQLMFHGGNDELFQMLIAAHSKEDIPTAVASIRQVLKAAHDYTEDFTVTDQAAMLSSFTKIFAALKFMIVGIASISLLVGGIGIMNIMLVSVRERTREVGIRKAVGATRRDIGIQFLIESVTLSGLGGLLGIFIGWLGTSAMSWYYPSFPISTSLWSVMMAFLFSLSVGVFFGVYPAIKASSVDPVEALRYE
jgi:putative ABC transport system permease protein